jgi:hypothetical protein
VKTAVETAWAIVGLCAYVLALVGLVKLGMPTVGTGYVTAGLILLVCVTWFTHWQHWG